MHKRTGIADPADGRCDVPYEHGSAGAAWPTMPRQAVSEAVPCGAGGHPAAILWPVKAIEPEQQSDQRRECPVPP